MSTTAPHRRNEPASRDEVLRDDSAEVEWQFSETFRTALKPLASLKLTVVLFALAIFIVLAGTLAQVNQDIWEVINVYFRVNPADVFIGSFPWINLNAFFVWVDFQLFAPPSFFPSKPDLPSWFGIPFPKGWLIGAVMMLNLFAAHLVRFKVQTSGRRLWSGVGIIALGVLVTTLVVMSGSNPDGFQEEALISWGVLWAMLQLGLLAVAAGSIYGLFSAGPGQSGIRWLMGVIALTVGGTLLWTIIQGPGGRLDDAYMRIMYQLVKATIAGLVLLAGCVLVFKKRAGIVLLHGGVGLMMVSEVLVGVQAEEAQLRIEEGRTSNFVEDIREVELAFVRNGEGDEQTHTVIPGRMLREGESISSDELPVDVKVLQYHPNASLVRRLPGQADDSNPATQGIGLRESVRPLKPSTGTESEVDFAAAYVQLSDPDTGDDLGTWLVGLQLDLFNLGRDRQTIEVGGESYDINLRFKRIYKPYQVTLLDVKKEDYIGTTTPRDYSSYVHLVDDRHGIDRDNVRIWMNNPLRYAGETFYQSSYTPAGGVPGSTREWTTLQVVKNTGWMIPYVACMIVLVGMLAQFGQTLIRFLQRLARGNAPVAAAAPGAAGTADFTDETDLPRRRDSRPLPQPALTSTAPAAGARPVRGHGLPNIVEVAVAAALVLCVGALFLYLAQMPKYDKGEMDLTAFGQILVVSEGRPKPIDTVARNSLLILSNRQALRGRMDERTLQANWKEIEAGIRKEWPEVQAADLAEFDGQLSDLAAIESLIEERSEETREQVRNKLYALTSESQPAVKWLLDVASESEVARHHRIFRIENLELIETLGLERRDGFKYSIDDFSEGLPRYFEHLADAEAVAKENDENLTFYQRKVLEFRTKLQTYRKLQAAFALPELPPFPTVEQVQTNPEQAKAQLGQFMMAAGSAKQDIMASGVPLMIPLKSGADDEAAGPNGRWIPFSIALLNAYINSTIGMEFEKDDPREMTVAFNEILTTYHAGQASQFDDAVAEFSQQVQSQAPASINLRAIRFESFFNHFEPFFYSSMFYVVAFVLTCLSWLVWTRGLNWSAFALIALVFAVHTFAIIGRIYISGRPPVTNLYSSAVFIGWACVVAGLIIEVVYRLGVGNVIASVAGFITLGIAHLLAGDGDTFTVLQAVLDTQFWLATHVVCITLGYAATYVAGLLAVVYILRGLATPTLLPDVGKALARMTYGALCFALFFSFVGTVLGGLWADDSWGRFWGWDPKENGALMIVLWNALVLHARWDGMVKDRGMAVLAVLGNICVSWSWFGVNELGVGLHSYGFTEGVLFTLGMFSLSQVLIALAGCLPKTLWWSHQRHAAA